MVIRIEQKMANPWAPCRLFQTRLFLVGVAQLPATNK